MKQKLINAVIKNKDKLTYANLNENNEYKGWTYDFNIILTITVKENKNLVVKIKI